MSRSLIITFCVTSSRSCYFNRKGSVSMSRGNSTIKLPPSPQSLADSGSDAFDRCMSFQRSVDLVGQVFDYTKSLYYERQLDLDGFTSLDEQLQSLLGQSLRNSLARDIRGL